MDVAIICMEVVEQVGDMEESELGESEECGKHISELKETFSLSQAVKWQKESASLIW
jgi:hypothetical protein